MRLKDLIESKDIEIGKLEKGLKVIGLSLSKFENINEEYFSTLIELFKIAVNIDSKSSTKFTKIDIRSKLEKILKGQPISIQSNTISTIDVTDENVVSIKELKKLPMKII
jgi:hypothetical protein